MPSFSGFHNMTRWFYNLLLHVLLPFILLRLYWRGRRAPGYRENRLQRFGMAPGLPSGGLVVHAVSLGETLASQPLVNALLKDYPELPLTVTNTTATGAERTRALWSGKVAQCFLPYDFPWAVRTFLNRARPRLFIVMETELWPNLLHELKQRGIPVLLANARLSERSARGYGRVSGLTRPMLQCLSMLAAQDADTARRFGGLGMPESRTTVTGSLKFDLTLPDNLEERAAALREAWRLTGRPVWVAASTHEGEDAVVLEVFRQVRLRFPELLLILVPRHPERFDRMADLLQKQDWRYVRRSLQQPVAADTQVLLGDSVGELLLWLTLADVAFVGGSLVGVGGHNPLEPAALSVPVLTGPVMFNFQQITDTLIQAGALVQASDALELQARLTEWLSAPEQARAAGAAGARVVADNRGALSRHMALVSRLLSEGGRA
ncbi:3-deoxy-D-manno-octulosonic-acid transferase [Fluviicoccus keumensis]|uniref:3-deoxy-D-manno-octulosonic acid transferase n=2 Tax=Fluviicoccus keumensis TaxID=1435465 RepID=A0A4Q7YF60_9GAMM|nr:3-deoxy-D-manno-octulosonic-acid transferase [Fluviicoccus keumensis]